MQTSIGESFPPYIQMVPNTHLEKVREFILMTDFLKNLYPKNEYDYIIKNMIGITDKEIELVKFNDVQFKKLMVYYLKDHAEFKLEREIVGDYTGYEGNNGCID